MGVYGITKDGEFVSDLIEINRVWGYENIIKHPNYKRKW
jgi:hypothetical protein